MAKQSEKQTQQEATPVTSETQAAQSQEVNISFEDIRAMIGVIDVASKRGAFSEPSEYAAIGQLYSKLTTFVKQVEEQVKSQQNKDQ